MEMKLIGKMEIRAKFPVVEVKVFPVIPRVHLILTCDLHTPWSVASYPQSNNTP